MKFLVVGSMNYDHVYRMKHIVRAKETAAADSMETVSGGKGLNQAVALAKAGAAVWMAGAVGSDGEELLQTLQRYGVRTDCVRRTAGRSGHAVIQVEESGQNAILLYGGSNQCVTEDDLETALGEAAPGDWLVLQNEINLTGKAIELGNQKGMRIALNPSPFSDAVPDWELQKVSLFFLNEVEGMQITGETDEKRMQEALMRMFPKAEVILTLGEQGAVRLSGGKRLFQPALAVPVTDTTAAGDTFTGYYLAAKARGFDPKEGMYLAAKAASLTIQKKGAAPSIPFWTEVLEEQ